MVSRQVSPTGRSRTGTLPLHTAGLNHLCLLARDHGLEYLWNEFESRISDLFLDDPAESRVGVIISGRDQLDWATTPEEICTTAGKGKSRLL